MTSARAQRLEAIKAREQAATGRAWWWESRNGKDWLNSDAAECILYRGMDYALTPADAEFIAHSRDDVPYLIAQVEAQGWQPIVTIPNEWTDGRDVLVLNDRQPRVARWYQGDWRYAFTKYGGMLTCLDVTHFSTLPSPPPDGSETT